MYTSYFVSVGDPTMQYTFVCLDPRLEDLKMTRCESKHVAHIVIDAIKILLCVTVVILSFISILETLWDGKRDF